ncbi:hypothetical protein AK812_SmicGene46950, partial [Symbiodinium microadriaticum]
MNAGMFFIFLQENATRYFPPTFTYWSVWDELGML